MYRIVAAVALSSLIAALAPVRAAQPHPQPMLTPVPAPSAAVAHPTHPYPRATLPPPPPPPILPNVPHVAPGYSAPKLEAPSANIVGITQQPFVGLTLENAVGMALSQNADLAVAQGNRRIAGYQIRAAQGYYDIRFQIEPSYRHTTTPPTNPIFGGPNFGPEINDTTQIQGGVQGQLPTGGQYRVTVSGERVTDNGFANSFNPYYPSVFSVTYDQPLLKDLGINQPRLQLDLARVSSDSSNQQTLVTAQQTLASVENTYWDLVAAWRNVAIQETALKQAVDQQNSNRRLAAQGVNAPIDAVESSTQVNVFQSNVYAALENVAALQNELKSLVVTDPNDPIWRSNLVPTTPVLQLPAQPSLDTLITQALANRPELAQVRDQLHTADLNLSFAKNQTKPDISLDLGYTSNGLAGNPLNVAGNPFLHMFPTPPPYLVGGVGQSFSNLSASKFPSYAVGLIFSVPLENNTAKANLSVAQEQARLATIEQTSTLQRIALEVRNALQSYKSAQYRLQSAAAARAAAEAVLASEQRRFRNGVSTTFLVLQRQVTLANDRGLELQAQTDLNKSVVELDRATGTLLRANNVDYTQVGAGALK